MTETIRSYQAPQLGCKAWLWSLFFLGTFLSALMFKTTILHPDHMQILDKAVKLVQTGEWTHYGNRSTKVGSIPGSFLTAMSAGPMALWYSPYAACAVVLLFHGVSLALLMRVGRFINATLPLHLFLIFFWLNPWRVEQSELFNPAYLFLFASVHLWTSMQMSEKKFWSSCLHVLAIGFCLQVHFSFLILALISLIQFVRGQIRIQWGGFSTAVILVALSLLPYGMARYGGETSSVEQAIDVVQSDAFLGRNFVLVYPVIKALIYQVRMGSTYFGRHIFTEIEFSWLGEGGVGLAVKYAFLGLAWVLAAVTLFYSGRAFFRFLRREMPALKRQWCGPLRHQPEDRFNDYFLGLLLSVFLTAGLSPVEFNHWHFILCFPAISLFLILRLATETWHRRIAVIFLVIFVVWNLLAALHSRTHRWDYDFARQFDQRYGSASQR
jgi:hypothetical protein